MARARQWLQCEGGRPGRLTPSFLENDIGITTLPTTLSSGATIIPRITGITALAAETLIAYEIGCRAQVTEKLSFDVALFYNSYDRLFTTQSGTSYVDAQTGALTLPVDRSNGGSGETYGAEVTATWQIVSWWRLTGNYSYLKMNLHADRTLSASLAAGFEKIEQQNPRNHVYIRSSFDLPRHVEFDVTGRYVDSVAGFSPGIRSFFTMDARLAWKPRPDFELAIVGQNLLEEHHTEFGTSSLVRSPLVDVQRSLYMQVTYKF